MAAGAAALALVLVLLPAPAGAASVDLVTSVSIAGPARAGLDLVASVGVDNAGDAQAGGLTVALSFPPTVSVASLQPSAGTCQAVPGTVTCAAGALAPGARWTLAASLTPTQAGSTTFEASATAAEADANPVDNEDSASATVAGPSCGLVGTQGADDLEAGPGGAVVCGLGGSDTLTGGDGDDVLVGGSGRDRAVFPEGPVTASVANGTATGHGSDELVALEHLTGSPEADVLEGSAVRNVLRGARGPDRLEGRGGPDVLDGGPGPDDLEGGKGRDGVTLARAAKPLLVELAEGSARGHGTDDLRGIEDVTGSRHDDVLFGSGARNRLLGGGGNDVLRGEGAADVLLGGRGRDAVAGGAGRDRLDGGGGSDGCLQAVGRGTKRRCEVLAWAEAPDVALFLPTRSLVGIGFHESLFGSAAALRPHGRIRRNDHGGYSAPAPTDGPSATVMASRGRGTPATSAADLVVGSRSPVVSPVTGTVFRVRRYLLYCDSPDWQVLIRPAGRPDLVVMVLHMATVRVDKGDDVVAGATRLGRAATNDGPTAQANQYFPDAYPHIHIEVERHRATPIPGCPI